MSNTLVAHNIEGKSRTGDVLISENVNFSGLLLSDNILSGLQKAGFQRPSPIQLKAIPLGRCGLDLIVQAKSGTGKTCVFSVIALEGIQTKSFALQVLVLAPTREIATQIWDVINSIGQCIPTLRCHTFIGGMPVVEDKQKLKRCHIAVGTPGRIKQLIETNIMNTDSIRMFVLDEADKLLEESFQEQINWIYSTLPENKQMLALSATYPEYLAQHLTSYMRNPTFLRLNISDPALLGIKQFKRVVDYHALPNKVFDNKTKVVIELLSSVNFQQCLIFSNLQTRAQNMADVLISHGWPTACIAGSHDQRDRNEAMSQLKAYKCRVLISTDLTSRGIDADKVNMVINLDVPKDHETYLHRIGRAGRFGTFGAAVNIISHGQEEKDLKKVEKRCKTCIKDLPDPIPNTLAKSEGTICLDDMVSTEQIMTDHTRISPKKAEIKQQNHDPKNESEQKSQENGRSGQHLKNLKSDFQNCLKNKTMDVRSSSCSENETHSEEKLSSSVFAKKCENKSFLNECADDKIELGQLSNHECKEKSENNDQITGKSRCSDKGKTGQDKDFDRAAKYEVRNLKGEKKIQMKNDSGLKIQIPKLDNFLSRKKQGTSLSFDEKEREYQKYLEERDTSANREEIIVKATPFVWKENEKEQLVSMIDKILILQNGSDVNVENDSEKNKVKSACAEVQTDSFDFLPNMKDHSTLTTQTQTKKHVRKHFDTHRGTTSEAFTEPETVVLKGRDQPKESQLPGCSVVECKMEHACSNRNHGFGSDQVGGWSNEEKDSYDTLREEVEFEEQDLEEEEEQTYFEYPFSPNSDHSYLNNHCLGEQYPTISYNSFGYPSPAQMRHEQRKQLFNYQLSLSLYQQNYYISAMLGYLY